jgi:hypothetical protein
VDSTPSQTDDRWFSGSVSRNPRPLSTSQIGALCDAESRTERRRFIVNLRRGDVLVLEQPLDGFDGHAGI